jgi:hypothetical protein
MERDRLRDACAMLAACDTGQLRHNMRAEVEALASQIDPVRPPRPDPAKQHPRFTVETVDNRPEPALGDETVFDGFEDHYSRHGAGELLWHKKDAHAVEVFAWLVAALDSRTAGSALVVTNGLFAVVARRTDSGVHTLVFLARGERAFEYEVQNAAHAAWLRKNLEKQGHGNSWIIVDEL